MKSNRCKNPSTRFLTVNTDHVEPLVHMTPAMNQFREDVAKQDLSKEKALALGPDTNEQYFKVPQVIE